MATIYIKEYYEMGNEDCIRNGYMILTHDSKYYVRLAGFPLMVLLAFDDIKSVYAWIDLQDDNNLLEKNREIYEIRKFQKRFGSC